jgi:hypothetical protein
MFRLWLLFLLAGIGSGCTATPWSWQDTGTPARLDASADLDACRSYASSQYTPGVPAGDSYQQIPVNYADPAPLDKTSTNPGSTATGTWHPDREPFPYTSNYQGESRHGVVVPYTGYPGYYDYDPGYLDALVEKCMADRGWSFRPTPNAPR